MLSLNYHLRATGGAQSPIYLFAIINRKYLRFSINEKINPAQWNSNSQRARISTKNTKAENEILEKLNSKLQKTKSELTSYFTKAEFNGQILTPDFVKETINTYLNPQPEVKPEPEIKITLFKFIEDYITSCKNSQQPNTIKTYTSTLNHLRDFAAKTKQPIDFENINLTFYDKFTSYLITKLGHSKNTVGKYIKILKRFMKEAAERDLHTNFEFKKKGFAVTSEEADTIYLNIDELTTLFNLDLHNKPKLDRVRDLFLIGCFTGLRFSDFSRLTADNIQGDEIHIRTQKTNQKVVILMRAEVMAILRKYKGELPRAISNQKMNEYLKELGRLAEINSNVTKTTTRGANRVHTTRSKYEMITTHTARRSFATNAFLQDVPTLQIMKITGHKTESSFMKYIKMSAEDNARKLQAHPFFNNTLPETKLKAVS